MIEFPPLPSALEKLVEDLCEVFARACQSGTPPDLERLVTSVPPEARQALFSRLLDLELAHRHAQGCPLTPEQAYQRFAGLGDFVEAILADRGVERPAGCLALRVTTGPHAGETYQLRGHNLFLVGRGDRVHLSLPQDLHLSRLHLYFEFNPPLARVVDSGSKHGTYLNQVRIDAANLTSGDAVRAGQTTFEITLSMPPGEETGSTPPLVSVPAMSSPAQASHGWPNVPGFVFEKKCGEGGMGVVYQARRLADDMTVALKTVQPAMAPRPTLMTRFQREVRILERLDHPHIVRFLGAGETQGMLYFTMEYVDGTSAAELVKTLGVLSPERVVALGCQLLDALGYAHDLGFVHRDVKPGNLLLTRVEGKDWLKLADFGLAKTYEQSVLSGLTVSGTPGGTFAFMPPEQVTDFRHARPPADQYSAAASLYYLLTGEHIYERSPSAAQLMQRILWSEPIPLREPPTGPALPPRLIAVLRRALARDPTHRYPDVRSFRAALQNSS